MDIDFLLILIVTWLPAPSSVHAGTPGVSLFKQAHFGRVKGRYLTRHGPTIKAPFESSTFINLKQSLDLKAESSKLPERIIKQPVSSSVHFSAICTRHFTVSGGRPISPQQPPGPVLSGFPLSRLSCLSRSQRGGDDRGVSLGSRLPSARRLSAGEGVRIPDPQSHSVQLRSRRWPHRAPPRPPVARASSAPQKRGLAAPIEGCEGWKGALKMARSKFQTFLPYTPHPPPHCFASWPEITYLPGRDSSELALSRVGVGMWGWGWGGCSSRERPRVQKRETPFLPPRSRGPAKAE